MKYLPTKILLVLLILATPGMLLAEPEDAVLGSDGTTYLLLEGAYGDLFPSGDVTTPDHRVLALEILRPDEEPQFALIPDTLGIRPENSRHIFFEDASSTVHVLWERWNGSHSALRLASFADGSWSDVVSVSDDPWSVKGSPQLVISRDRFEIPEAEGAVRTIQRTILHVLWWEETAAGDQAMYRPLILLGGIFQEPGPAVVLNDLLPTLESGTMGASPTATLLHRPIIIPGRDSSTAAVAFVDDERRVVTMEVQVLPPALGLMAEAAHDTVLESGSDLLPARPDALADLMRGHLIDVGHRMNPRDLGFIGDVMRGHLIDVGHRANPTDLGTLADVMRGHLIDVGVRIARERLVGALGEAPPFLRVLEMVFPQAEEEDDLINLIGIASSLVVPLPEIPEGEAWLFPAPDGKRILVAWQTNESVLHYREVEESGSGKIRSLALSDDLSLPQAHELLRKRVAR